MKKPSEKRKNDIGDAIGELAALFEYGELQARTDPAGFLRMVAAELRALRGGR